jgi:hypothetical protein
VEYKKSLGVVAHDLPGPPSIQQCSSAHRRIGRLARRVSSEISGIGQRRRWQGRIGQFHATTQRCTACSTTLDVPRGWLLASFMPLVPGVALNASLLASGDAFWAAPGIMVLASAARRRDLALLAWCGVALAVKQQAVCLAPFVRGVLLARRVPMRQWTALPAG